MGRVRLAFVLGVFLPSFEEGVGELRLNSGDAAASSTIRAEVAILLACSCIFSSAVWALEN